MLQTARASIAQHLNSACKTSTGSPSIHFRSHSCPSASKKKNSQLHQTGSKGEPMLRRPATRLNIQNEDLDELLNVGTASQSSSPADLPQSTAARIGMGQ